MSPVCRLVVRAATPATIRNNCSMEGRSESILVDPNSLLTRRARVAAPKSRAKVRPSQAKGMFQPNPANSAIKLGFDDQIAK
jgi:hypothetical protein